MAKNHYTNQALIDTTPTAPNHLVDMQWVQNYVIGKVKLPVRAISTINIPGVYAPGAAPDPAQDDSAARKRAIYEALSPRRRAFINRLGYAQWDPFQEPNNPPELRKDATQRTTRQLVREFLQSRPGETNNAYANGALECALGLINKDEKFRGIYEFCIWYRDLLRDSE